MKNKRSYTHENICYFSSFRLSISLDYLTLKRFTIHQRSFSSFYASTFITFRDCKNLGYQSLIIDLRLIIKERILRSGIYRSCYFSLVPCSLILQNMEKYFIIMVSSCFSPNKYISHEIPSCDRNIPHFKVVLHTAYSSRIFSIHICIVFFFICMWIYR